MKYTVADINAAHRRVVRWENCIFVNIGMVMAVLLLASPHPLWLVTMAPLVVFVGLFIYDLQREHRIEREVLDKVEEMLVANGISVKTR